MAAKRLRIAADTNVLLDLADEVESVQDALGIIDQRLSQADKIVTPSVLDELAYLCDSDETAQIRACSCRAMNQLSQGYYFRPLLELPFSSEVIENLAEEMRSAQLLPREEIHDSRILAEAILLGCGILLTSDEHLRSIDHQAMTLTLNRLDLAPPVIATPREIVRKFFR